MQAEIDEIVKISLKKALDHEAKGNIGQAYAYYTAVLELCPAKRSQLEKRFISVLCELIFIKYAQHTMQLIRYTYIYCYYMTGEWGIQLEQKNRLNDVSKCYKNSFELFPRNAQMLNNFAAHLLR